MLKKFLPRQEGFFDFFQKTADILATTAIQFHAMLNDLKHQQQYVDAIAAYEDDGDKMAHTTFELLHKTFITPFDRNDIHQLTSGLDDILDFINRCAQRFPFYGLSHVPEEMIQLARLSMQASMLLKEAVYRLNSLKKSGEILQFCSGIDQIEREAHRVVLVIEKDLYLNENDFKQFFKLKEICARIKEVINSYQDVANIIKGIVLEYS
jgi:uncharacterized protein Yka (UPF0111/DUF47 family)